jgi:hypothetical protein
MIMRPPALSTVDPLHWMLTNMKSMVNKVHAVKYVRNRLVQIHVMSCGSPIGRAGDTLESRRQSLIVIQTGVIERNHQATPDDQLSVRVLHKGSGYKISSVLRGFSNLNRAHALTTRVGLHTNRCIHTKIGHVEIASHVSVVCKLPQISKG